MGAKESVVAYEGLSTSNFPRKEGTPFQLKDGRIIGYVEYGQIDNPDPINIFFIPGQPGSRFFMPDDTKLDRLNLRVIVIERPGYGLSTPDPKGTLLSFADDLDEVAESLKIVNYGIVGYSAGGPFALATLSKYSHKIFGAAIVSSVAPREPQSNYTRSMGLLFKIAWWASYNAPWLIDFAFKTTEEATLKNPVKQGREEWSLHSKIDYDIYKSTPHIEKLFIASSLEMGMRKQSASAFHDWKLFAANWGFEIDKISVENVTVYHGTRDSGCSVEMGECIAKKMPQSRKRFVDGKGHLLIFDLWDEIMETLLSDSKKHARKAESSSNMSGMEGKIELVNDLM